MLQVKVEMELEIQQYEKAKVVRDEQLDRLTQICQEQAVRRLIHSYFLFNNSLPFIFLQVTSRGNQRAVTNKSVLKKAKEMIPLYHYIKVFTTVLRISDNKHYAWSQSSLLASLKCNNSIVFKSYYRAERWV